MKYTNNMKDIMPKMRDVNLSMISMISMIKIFWEISNMAEINPNMAEINPYTPYTQIRIPIIIANI